MSWKTAVKVSGEPDWSYNALRFATKEEAEAYGEDLANRWVLVREVEAQEDDEPVNYQFVNGILHELVERR